MDAPLDTSPPAPPGHLRLIPRPQRVILGIILCVGAALRYYGLNWDFGSGLHPDERHITSLLQALALPTSWAQFLSPGHVSPLEPGDFAYGSLPLYLYWIAGHVAVWLGSWVPGLSAWQNALGSSVFLTGRIVSAAAGVLTILVVYLLGLRLYGRTVGLLAAAFFAVCVLDVQLSHFLAVDTLATLFATLAVYACVCVAQQRRPADFLWAGAWTGAALACKVSMLPLLLPLMVAPFLTGDAAPVTDEAGTSPDQATGARAQATGQRAGGHTSASATGPGAGEPRQRRGESGCRAAAASGCLPPTAWGRVGWLLAAVGALLAVFFITQPYALIDWNRYLSDVASQARLASGQDHVFYTVKFYGTPPYWYHLEHIVPWDLGWPLGLAAVAGVLAATGRALVRRRRDEAVLLLWTLAYFGATGGQFMKYVRYMLPTMPPLCLFAAALLLAPLAGARRSAFGARPVPAEPAERRTANAERLARALALGVLALTVLYALAYDNIYSTLNTRLAASLWFEAHVKPGTPFTVENLDEGIPWSFDGHPVPPGYAGTSIGTAAGGDTLQTWTGGVRDGPPAPASFAATIANAQYVTIFGDRIMGTVPHLPQAFPYAGRYYCLLFGPHPPAGVRCPPERALARSPYPLGFRLVRSFSNHAHLFGITLDDYPADQNFSEYDHPPVWIFQRVRAVSPAQTAALITDNGRIADVPQVAVPDKSLLLTPQEQAVNATGPSYAQEFGAGSLPMRLPVLVWLAWLEGLGLLALPLALRLFRRLPDRGFVLAKTVGLLLVAYLTWLAASLHLLRFALPTILGAAALVALASLLWGVPLHEVRASWRAKRTLVERAEWVFLAGFFADVVVRMIYPDLWHAWNGGEKPMDFSYLNGLVRSQTMPPADPWFAGGYMNYYYYGYFLVATLIKLTGIAPSVAYNLAVPTLFGLTLASAYTIAYALTRRTGIALLAAGLTALAGNLYTGVQVAAVLMTLSPVHLSLPVLGGAVELLGGLWQLVTQQWLLQHQVFPALSFRAGPYGWGWDSTRVIYSTNPGETINEFPFFTFLYADLHAHMIDLPVLLACIALAASAALGARPWLAGERGEAGRAVLPGAGLAMLLVTAIVVGSTGPTNTWDVITALLLVALGVAVSTYTAGVGLRLALASAALFGAVLAVLAAGLFYPFYSHLKSFYSTIGFTLAHTALNQFLMVWGLFLFVVASYVAVELWRGAMGVWLRQQARAGEFVLYYWPQRARVLRLLRAVGVQQRIAGRALPVPQQSLGIMAAGVLLSAVALVMRAPVLAVLLLLIAAVLAALLDGRQAPGARRLATGAPLPPTAYRLPPVERRFALLLALLALGLAAVCEVAYLADFLAGGAAYRMNTVFKLYEQAWPLFAIASAAALAAMIRPLTPPAWPAPRIGLKPESAVGIVAAPMQGDRRQATGDRTAARLPPTAYRLPPSLLRRLWLATLGLLLFAAALYPLLEAPAHLAERASSGYWIAAGKPALGPTLDGTAFVQKAFPREDAALRWLNAYIKGDPTVLSSDSGLYDNFAFRVPWMTGLPNVVEWGEEQGQQRYSGQPDTGHWPYAPYPNEVGDRDADVRTMYATADTALALRLLHKYQVTYVYVGLAERGQQPDPSIGGPPSGCYAPDAPNMPPNPECVGYPSAGLAKFGTMAASGALRVVYKRGGVTIFKVVR